MFKVNDNVLMCTRRGVAKGIVTHIDSRCDDVVITWTTNSNFVDSGLVEHLTQFDVSRRAIRLANEESVCCNCKHRLQALMGHCPSDRFVASQQEERMADASAGRIN